MQIAEIEKEKGEKGEKEEKDEDDSDDGNSVDSNNELDNQDEETYFKIGSGLNKYNQIYKNKESTIVDIICDNKFEREGKINELIRSLRNNFPALEGDKVTFIGSTFLTYGDKVYKVTMKKL